MRRPGTHKSRALGICLSLVVSAATILTVILSANTVRSTDAVDLVLVLALDTSHSVDDGEFSLQRDGIASAFRHPAVLDAIRRGRHRRIGVAVMQWAGEGQQIVSVPWTVIGTAISAATFADEIAQLRRRFFGGRTHIAGAIQAANALTQSAPFAATRRVVDVSGDGINTVGNSPHGARDAALLTGLTINGLAITNEAYDLAEYYRLSVIGGPDAFVIQADDYDDYARAILEKLLREINPRVFM